MKNINHLYYLVTVILLYSCEPNGIEEVKKYDWKDVSIQSVNVDWRSIQMLDEKNGFIGGYPKTQFLEEVLISQEQIIGNDFVYNVDYKYAKSSLVPETCFYMTTDGGETWNAITTPFRNGISQICFINNREGYVSCIEGVFKTNNKGETWQKILYSTVFGKNQIYRGQYRLYFVDNLLGYAFFDGINAFTLKTTNGGSTWSLIENINGEFIYQKSPISYTTTKNSLYKTTDNQATWTKLNINTNYIYNVFFQTADYFLVASDNKIIETMDGGITWNFYSMPIKYATRKMIVFDKVVYALDTENIYHFEDFTRIDATKTPSMYYMTKELNEKIYNICFPNSSFGFAIGDNGMILKYVK